MSKNTKKRGQKSVFTANIFFDKLGFYYVASADMDYFTKQQAKDIKILIDKLSASVELLNLGKGKA